MIEEKVDSLKIYTLAEDFSGYNSFFWAQHGVSFLIEAKIGEDRKYILFDTANHADPILHNLQLLKKEISVVDYIVLSHNHYDHTGGLLGLLKEMKKSVPIFAHPDIFKMSYSVDPYFRYIGPPINMREEAEKYGGMWVLSREPIYIVPGIFTLGEIKEEERVEWERGATRVVMINNGEKVEDYMEDEIGLGINTQKGLVIFGGCSHPGIVSMVKRAIEISGISRIHAVIGGFHLVSASDERILKTVTALKDLGVEKIYTGHCTGLQAECEFRMQLNKNFHKLHAGMVISI